MDPPSEEIVARRELDPFVAEFRDFARQFFERKMAVHVWIESDFHGTAPSVTRGGVARGPREAFLMKMPAPAWEAAGAGRLRVASARRL